MAIKKYYANADNTITNAYKEDLANRGTGSNMGQSDILEVFSLYAYQGSESSEIARTLIKFPISTISTDRTNGDIPASGSVKWYLNIYNAEHSRTLPRDYSLTVTQVSGAWQEGRGLDMETYKDETYDREGSNWINSSGPAVAATATVTVANEAWIDAGDTITLVATDGTSVVCTMHANTTTSAAATTAVTAAKNGGSTTAVAAAIATAINYSSYFSAEATNSVVTITQAVTGHAGNTVITIAEGGATGFSKTDFIDGSGAWHNEGGDTYYPGNESFIDQKFEVGDEDLHIDATMLVEQWLKTNPVPNHGFMVRLSSSLEATGSGNLTGSTYSHYTKKFFGRGSEYFFERPTLEARWNSARKDNRGNMYFSSSLAPEEDNNNTLYLYNYIRGRLRDIGNRSTNLPIMRLFYSSGSVPEGNERGMLSASSAGTVHGGGIKASRVSTGLYKVQFSVTASAISGVYQYLQDVWSLNEGVNSFTIYTGSAMNPKTFAFSDYNPGKKYVLSIPNNKKSYYVNTTERIRLHVREKNWNPNVYTRIKTVPDNIMIESASYQFNRTVDDRVVIPYGTGSDNHTMLSYDVSGNYFDFGMKLLEPGYTYDLKFSFYEDSISSWREQPYIFKIRVDKDEY